MYSVARIACIASIKHYRYVQAKISLTRPFDWCQLPGNYFKVLLALKAVKKCCVFMANGTEPLNWNTSEFVNGIFWYYIEVPKGSSTLKRHLVLVNTCLQQISCSIFISLTFFFIA